MTMTDQGGPWDPRTNPPPSSQPGWTPRPAFTEEPRPPKRRRGKLVAIIASTLVGGMLLFGACLAVVANMDVDTTGTVAEPQPTVTLPPDKPNPTTGPQEPAEQPVPSNEGKVGVTAVITDNFNESEGEIALEQVDRASGAVHLRLHVTSTKGSFDINPYDFYLRKPNDERIDDTSWDHNREPSLHAATLRKGKGVRGWLSYDVETIKGYRLVYAPGLGDDVFEWKL